MWTSALRSDSALHVGQTRISRCGHMTPRWPNEGQRGWKWLSETFRKTFVILNESTPLEGASPGWFRPQHARGDGKLREQPSVGGGGGWQFCLRGGALCLRRVREALLHLGVLWHCRHKMDDNGSPRQTAGEESSSPDSHRTDVRFQQRVAAVSSPALPGARLTLPGVMDAEGRVDESRLRMHIFKNGRKLNNRGTHYWSHAYLHPIWLLARTSDFSYIYS